MRDGDWFTKVFEKLRIRFPHYRVAIFYVKASKEVAWKRCESRAIKTGRAVPRQLFDDSIYKPDRVLSQLTPKVDFVARINNDNEIPILEAYEHVDFRYKLFFLYRKFILYIPFKKERKRKHMFFILYIYCVSSS